MSTSSSPLPLLCFLGPVAVARPDGGQVLPARLDAAVLAHLALAAGRTLPIDDLAEAVWGGTPPTGARNALQVKVSRLRRLLGPDGHRLEHVRGSYRLDVAAEDVDVHRFRALSGKAAAAMSAGETATAAAVANQASTLWRGVPFANWISIPAWLPRVRSWRSS